MASTSRLKRKAEYDPDLLAGNNLGESFVSFGTALPSLASTKKDQGEYVPVWKQVRLNTLWLAVYMANVPYRPFIHRKSAMKRAEDACMVHSLEASAQATSIPSAARRDGHHLPSFRAKKPRARVELQHDLKTLWTKKI